MALLGHPLGEGRGRQLCHKGDWLAGVALVCLFEGSWMGLLGFSGVALVSQGVCFG